ncbi:Ig-like domain repeat protein [Methanobrevibacter sp. DSM 116169]|uniref:Ig-like domain repeat protein n=1 Tax=Methanobrevibacter sp. DSM 116169 TaxID=3242727 RepID=UPI0038FBE780
MQSKKITIFAILAAFILLISISSISAIGIDNTTGGGIKQGIDNTAENDILTLDPGVYNKDGFDYGITIDKNITIQGNGPAEDVIIDAKGLDRIFTISSKVTVTFINITFLNGIANEDHGGAIYNIGNGTLTVKNSIFINNTATNSLTINDNGGFGGAIYNNGEYSSIEFSTFTNNGAEWGGGIHNVASNFNVINSFFNDNYASNSSDNGGYGGAIRNYGDYFTVINSIFINNSAINAGGAIWTESKNSKVVNTTFKDNSALHAGGAINIHILSDNFTIKNSTFIDNDGRDGGAISNYMGNDFFVIDSIFNNNTAIFNGGAIYTNVNNSQVFNSTFTNNGAEFGGAIYSLGDFFVVNNNSQFIENDAYNGGAIVNDGSNSIINNSFFKDNFATNAGGAITNAYVLKSAKDLIISNSDFINNKANYGAVIYNMGLNLNVIDSNFTKNEAFFNGGVIRNLGNDLNVINSTFDSNNATTGGAIHNSANNTQISISNFINNNASNQGGSIYNAGNMSVSKNFMLGNSARSGQMIYNTGNMGILNLTYINNSTLPVKKGDKITLNATLTDDMGNTVTGQNIAFNVNGTFIKNVTVIEGVAEFEYTVDLNAPAIVPVTGDYAGHKNYEIVLNPGALNLTKDPTNNVVNIPQEVNVGEIVTIESILTDKEGKPLKDKTIDFYVNGTKIGSAITDSNGVAKLNHTFTTEGKYDIYTEFVGDDHYYGSNATNNTVAKKQPTKNVVNIPQEVNVGQTVTIESILTDEKGNPLANKTIDFYLDGKKIGSNITNDKGIATLEYTFEDEGKYNVTTEFTGDNLYYGSEAVNQTVVAKIPTITTVEVPEKIIPGATEEITITLTDEDGNPLANKTLDVYVDNEKIGTVTTDENGKAKINHTFDKEDEFVITAEFAGDKVYEESTGKNTTNVAKIPTTTTVTVPDEITVGETVEIEITLTDEDGNPLANKTLDVYVDNEKIGTVTTDKDGKGYINHTFDKESKPVVEAKFSGDELYKESEGKDNTNVIKIPTITTIEVDGDTITVTVTDKDGNPLEGKEVTLTIGNTVIGVGITDKDGKVTFTYKDAYKHTITATFAGDDKYYDSTATYKPAVNPVDPVNPTNPTEDSNLEVGLNTANASQMAKTGNPIALVLLVLLAMFSALGFRKRE